MVKKGYGITSQNDVITIRKLPQTQEPSTPLGLFTSNGRTDLQNGEIVIYHSFQPPWLYVGPQVVEFIP